jgi:dTDP-4-dehydrorhamnose reductase
MSEILVTGAYGQLGSELKKAAPEFKDMSFLFTDADTLDITDKEKLRSFFSLHKIRWIVNCAAYTAVDKAETDRQNAGLVNSIAPGILAEIASTEKARMLHISTDYVFDGLACMPYSEENQVSPLNYYGITKLEGEKACLANNPESVVIRTSWLYSSFGKNFVKTILRIGKEGKPLRVVYDQIGSPTYAGDLACSILEIIRRCNDEPLRFVPGIYHFANEGVCSWYDFARAILDFSGLGCRIDPVETREFPTPAHRPHYSVLNKAKIKNTFDIEIPYWRDSLKKCIEIIGKEN